jgi:aminopeptidase
MKCSIDIRGGLLLFCIAAALMGVQPVLAEEARFGDLAKKVVTISANVKPGEVVVIYGGKHTIPLMEALAIEAQKAGGMVQMLLGSDRVTRSRFTEVPERYLELEPKYIAEWLRPVDVWIALPDVADAKATFGDVPEERFAKAGKAGQKEL